MPSFCSGCSVMELRESMSFCSTGKLLNRLGSRREAPAPSSIKVFTSSLLSSTWIVGPLSFGLGQYETFGKLLEMDAVVLIFVISFSVGTGFLASCSTDCAGFSFPGSEGM